MKITKNILLCTILFIFLSTYFSRITKDAKNLKPVKKVKGLLEKFKNITNITIIYKDHPPVNITDPKGTVLYQFALGASDVLVSDPKNAEECQPQPWMIDQPSVQAGTSQWFDQLAEPSMKLKGLMDIYALQAVCKKHVGKLRGWLAGALDKERERYQHAKSSNVSYDNIDYPDPYGNQSETVKVKNSTNIRRRMFLSKSKTESKRKAMMKSKTKDWWGVLTLSLPLVPYHLLSLKRVLDKMMRGWVFIQFHEFLDCTARSIDTPRDINDKIVAYRGLMAYLKKGYKTDTMNFGNVFSLLMCNWNRYMDHVDTLVLAAREKDEKKKWFMFGQAMAKLVVALSTSKDYVVLFQNHDKPASSNVN